MTFSSLFYESEYVHLFIYNSDEIPEIRCELDYLSFNSPKSKKIEARPSSQSSAP